MHLQTREQENSQERKSIDVIFYDLDITSNASGPLTKESLSFCRLEIPDRKNQDRTILNVDTKTDLDDYTIATGVEIHNQKLPLTGTLLLPIPNSPYSLKDFIQSADSKEKPYFFELNGRIGKVFYEQGEWYLQVSNPACTQPEKEQETKILDSETIERLDSYIRQRRSHTAGIASVQPILHKVQQIQTLDEIRKLVSDKADIKLEEVIMGEHQSDKLKYVSIPCEISKNHNAAIY
jgi:hypothetical protein